VNIAYQLALHIGSDHQESSGEQDRELYWTSRWRYVDSR